MGTDIFKEQIVESFKALREGFGLTAKKLKGHPLLYSLLEVESEEEGAAKVDELSKQIDDSNYRRGALRNALGFENTGVRLDARRKLITTSKEGSAADIPYTPDHLRRLEDDAFRQLADIILNQSSSPLLQETKPLAVENPAPAAPTSHFPPLFERIGKLEIALLVLVLLLGMSASGVLIKETALGTSVGEKVLTDRFSHPEPKRDNDAAVSKLAKPPVSLSAAKSSQTSDSGWGPERPTFTNENPAPYAAFNSITNNSLHGDERNFTQCRDKESGTWSTGLQVDNGHVYQCYIWFENAAAPNIAKGNPAAWLHDARARVKFSSAPQGAWIVGILSAANSRTVWSSCFFSANGKVSLSYVKGSAGIQRIPYYDDFRTVGDTITTPSGIRLGGEKIDGVIRQDVGYVLFDIKVAIE